MVGQSRRQRRKEGGEDGGDGDSGCLRGSVAVRKPQPITFRCLPGRWRSGNGARSSRDDARLTVIASGSAFRIDDLSVDARAIGQRLGARYLVLGSTQRAGDQLRVSARLVDTQSGRQVWSTSLDRRLADLFAIQDAIATQVADELRRRIQGIALPRPYTTHEPPIEAQLAYLQGRAFLARHTVRGSEAAAEKFAEAVALDPKFAAALAGLFDARMLAAERRHDDLAAERKRQLPLLDRALEIDPNCGAAYVARAIWGAETWRPRRRTSAVDSIWTRAMDEDSWPSRNSSTSRTATTKGPAYWIVRCWSIPSHRGCISGWRCGISTERRAVPRVRIKARSRDRPGLPACAAALLQATLDAARETGGGRADHGARDRGGSRQSLVPAHGDGNVPRHRRRAGGAGGCRGTQSSRESERLLLALYRGDWRTAGEVAYSPAGKKYNLSESWGAAEAVRDHSLQTGDYRRGIAFFESRYKLGGADPKLHITNFRAAAYLAQLLQASGDPVRAKGLLDRLPAEIDASIPRFESVLALRTKATVQLLSGDRQAALRTLAASFAANDLMQWWYTLNHDPLWKPLHDDPVFQALGAQVRSRVAQEQAELAELRRTGRIARGAGSTSREAGNEMDLGGAGCSRRLGLSGPALVLHGAQVPVHPSRK